MPEPLGRGQRYMPGLDGLRAIAVLAVVAFHLGFGWAQGGLLGVGVFFTLSGYLITDLLLGEWRNEGRVRLADFWLRRARRLLPALFVMLAVVAIWVAVGERAQLGPLRGDIAAAAVYGSNWWLIVQHVSYFTRFGPASPLGNLWSLAVEEQFYLIWPWLLLAGLWWVGLRGRRPRRLRRRLTVLAGATTLLAALSALEMALLYHPSFDPTRVYDATDTRAFGLLFGAALAMVWPSRSLRSAVTPGARRIIDAMGVIGLVGIGLLVWRTTEYSAFLYHGGMVLLSIATLLVVASATHPASRLGVVLGWGPLRWIGLISYGIYLWHYPIIVLTTPTASQGVNLSRAALQVAATVGLAALSWYLIETPIRHGALGRLWGHLKTRRLRGLQPRAWVAGGLALVALWVTSLGIAGALPTASAGVLAVADTSDKVLGASLSRSVKLHLTTTTTTTTPATTPAAGADAGTTTTTTAPPPLTSCTSVVYIGDSTSDSLISNDYLNPPQQLPAQLARVGVTSLNLQISGARSLNETYEGEPNGIQVAQQILAQGYKGCWVVALGTNDAADVAVGSSMSMSQRITAFMQLVGNQPVVWVNVLSLLSSGYYAESNMAQWDQDLVQACTQYPNMRVFNWAALAQPSYFISDGIHYNTPGSAVRAADIANGLAAAFPATSPSSTTTTTAPRNVSLHKHQSRPAESNHHRGGRAHQAAASTTTTTHPINCVVQ